MTTELWVLVLFSTLRLSTPLIYAALGGYFSERSGTVNIALEGMMLIGAFAAGALAHATHSAIIGILGAMACAGAMAAIHGLFCIELKADPIISGVALNLLALGLPPVISKAFFDMSGGTPGLEDNERMAAVFGISPLVAGAFVMALLVWILHAHTRLGQYLRFAGAHPMALQTQGVSVRKTRWIGVLACGALCGIAGAYLSVDHGAGFARNMTAGRGFIALAALILGRWTPQGALLGALLFGLIEALQIAFGNQGLPVQWVQMIPYIATLAILAFVTYTRTHETKANLSRDERLTA